MTPFEGWAGMMFLLGLGGDDLLFEGGDGIDSARRWDGK